MNPLLEQFLSEARDLLQGIAEKLMELEDAPGDAALMNELFRLVHTLKGNSGLFDFPEMTRVLHAGEDLMDAVRSGRVMYSRILADRLLDAMDFVGMLCDEAEADGDIGKTHGADAARLGESLRQLMQTDDDASAEASLKAPGAGADAAVEAREPEEADAEASAKLALATLPQAVRMEADRRARAGDPLHWLAYTPSEQCFYQGDDPFFLVRQTPELLWGCIEARDPWPPLADLDAYACVLDFSLLVAAPRAALEEHYRYVADQLKITPVAPAALALDQGDTPGDNLGYFQGNNQGEIRDGPVHDDCVIEALEAIIGSQRTVLSQTDDPAWLPGRIQSTAASLSGCLRAYGDSAALPGLEMATAEALAANSGATLLAWLEARFPAAAPVPTEVDAECPPASPRHPGSSPALSSPPGSGMTGSSASAPNAPASGAASQAIQPIPSSSGEGEVKFGRRAEDSIAGPKSLKVDQTKIDRLMNLIGEMVVAKNGLPYLAGRAEDVFGVRELSRDIKGHYAVINRIAEEMQDAIMQVRMMPVSFVFQRFPRLVRDISRKLGKEVHLVMEGEDTEADKNIIEALGDPLVHIVRNSLDHGFESPEVRAAAGKPAFGTLTLRASQESDRVVIEIRDDGKGIDPEVIKRKAYAKQLIDEATLERISDQEAVNLVFAAGLSTAETVSDLSGRGVGMDVVRTAVEQVNGAIALTSVQGQGTQLRLSVPLSMAVTNVMIVVSADQPFGVPMDNVVETVRVPQSAIRTIKHSLAMVLRGRIVPLKSINSLLGIQAPHKANADDELAVLVVRLGDESVGLLVDDFRETVDIILKPMNGVLTRLSAYAGSALMGDGSVLMVLNIKEIL